MITNNSIKNSAVFLKEFPKGAEMPFSYKKLFNLYVETFG